MSSETELIKDRLDIADLVGEYVQLRKTGGHHKGLCPFHNEKTPSLVVSSDKGIWHCFGCSEGGDAFSWLQKIEGMNFREALETLAERTGVELKSKRQASETVSERQKVFDIMALTTKFYHELLMRQKVGQKALDYMQKDRGVKKKTLEDFEIGYAPQSWDVLQVWLGKQGFNKSDMMRAGLVGESSRGTFYDRFRGRVMWPVKDIQGRVVAFGGRILPWTETGNEGKYVNSPETMVYEKRRTVYNLNKAKKELTAGTACLVVEGYMDVTMLAQAGIKNVVASSGTAFTGDQVKLLSRYTKHLQFAFDADQAGVGAALAGTREAARSGLRTEVIALPTGLDPADVVKSSKDEFKKYLEQPKSIIRFCLEILKDSNEAGVKEKMLEELLPLIAQVSNIVWQGELIVELASVLHVSEDVMRNQISKVKYEGSVSGEQLEAREQRLSAEQLMLGLILADEEIKKMALETLEVSDFIDERCKKLYIQLQHRGKIEEVSAVLAEAVKLEAVAWAEKGEVSRWDEARKIANGLRLAGLRRQLAVVQEGLVSGETKSESGLLEIKQITQDMAKLSEKG